MSQKQRLQENPPQLPYLQTWVSGDSPDHWEATSQINASSVNTLNLGDAGLHLQETRPSSLGRQRTKVQPSARGPMSPEKRRVLGSQVKPIS